MFEEGWWCWRWRRGRMEMEKMVVMEVREMEEDLVFSD